MSYAPVLGPPPSPEYFEEDYGPRLLAINCTLFSIAAVTMILRIYVRVFILKMFGIDGQSPTQYHKPTLLHNTRYILLVSTLLNPLRLAHAPRHDRRHHHNRPLHQSRHPRHGPPHRLLARSPPSRFPHGKLHTLLPLPLHLRRCHRPRVLPHQAKHRLLSPASGRPHPLAYLPHLHHSIPHRFHDLQCDGYHLPMRAHTSSLGLHPPTTNRVRKHISIYLSPLPSPLI